MNSMTVVMLLCLVAVAYAHTQSYYPAADEVANVDGWAPDAKNPQQESNVRNKRSLLLLKKKLLLGAIGLKAAKVGAVGLGVGALALKKNSQASTTEHKPQPKTSRRFGLTPTASTNLPPP